MLLDGSRFQSKLNPIWNMLGYKMLSQIGTDTVQNTYIGLLINFWNAVSQKKFWFSKASGLLVFLSNPPFGHSNKKKQSIISTIVKKNVAKCGTITITCSLHQFNRKNQTIMQQEIHHWAIQTHHVRKHFKPEISTTVPEIMSWPLESILALCKMMYCYSSRTGIINHWDQ